MKKLLIALSALIVLLPSRLLAWGRTGHHLVAEIAFTYLDDATKQKVLHYLNGMTIEDASTWMDELRGNTQYPNMSTWHYINIEKGQSFDPASTGNVVTELARVVNELKTAKGLTDEQIRVDLLIIFHLCGDISQPLHDGYGEDRGGNSIQVSFLGTPSNLHSVWDSKIIENKKITIEDCLNQKNNVDAPRKFDPRAWMEEGRAFLPIVYDIKDQQIGQDYIDRAQPVIERQILLGGDRLALVLKEVMAGMPDQAAAVK